MIGKRLFSQMKQRLICVEVIVSNMLGKGQVKIWWWQHYGLGLLWFEENYVKLVKFPLNFSDLNPIENLWWILKIKLYTEAKFRIKQQLWEKFETFWEKTEKSYVTT
ncbi:hypothetical protein RFI_31716 [Reticulomyxa filosa]|uniref:Tc1-like transposase DDE domain-containing protein n=1 Tax=Reticulomyxa filosa TaxID=46433 RepID=X6LY74_RETFI|nr:hypothetical protein RFI_31716 [Reticulomyxa filosa]|eukprot:ETO05680.1 hypothetical protein RFI_31716 [Reticulomyxa filosa]